MLLAEKKTLFRGKKQQKNKLLIIIVKNIISIFAILYIFPFFLIKWFISQTEMIVFALVLYPNQANAVTVCIVIVFFCLFF